MNDESNQLNEKRKLFVFFCNRQAKSWIIAKIIEFCFVNCNNKSRISCFWRNSIDCVNYSSASTSNYSKFEKSTNKKHQYHRTIVLTYQTTVQHTTLIVVSLIWKKHSKFEFFINWATNFHEFIFSKSINHQHFDQHLTKTSKTRFFECAIDNFISKLIHESNSISSNAFRCTKHTIRKKFKFIISNRLKFKTITIQTKRQRFVWFIWNRVEMIIEKCKTSNETSKISINASEYSKKNHIINKHSIVHYIKSTII